MAEQLTLFFDELTPKIKQLWTADEIYERLSATTLAQFSENRRMERKSGGVQAKDLGQYLSMWANTQPEGGIIVVGIEDNGKITGLLKYGEKRKNELENLSIFCEDARWTVKEVPVLNDKGLHDFVLAYRVNYRDDRVVETNSGRAFLREGSSKIEMCEALKREHRIAKGEIQYELESQPLTFPDDFETAEIQNFCKSFCEYRGFKEEKTTIDILVLAKLGKISDKQFRPNLACCLLFGRDPRSVIPGAMIRILRYEGKEEKFGKDLNIVFDALVEGPIPIMLEDAKQKVSSQIGYFQRLTGTRFEKRPEYPEGAWFEAIVNAVAHRSYNFKNQNIFVKMFDDRIVVESPGGFVPPTNAQSIYEAHNPRNPFLMQAMMHLRLTLCGFEGTRRMRDEMRSAQLPEPKFVQIEASSYQVHVTLHNRQIIPSDTKDTNKATFKLDEDELSLLEKGEREIVGYLSANPFITTRTAAIITNRSWPTANKYIQRLLALKILEHTEKDAMPNAPKRSYCLNRQRT